MYKEYQKKIRFLIVGGGLNLNKLKKIKNYLGLSNVTFYGHIKSNKMQKYFYLGFLHRRDAI